MPTTITSIAIQEIAHIEITCLTCHIPTLLPLEKPSKNPENPQAGLEAFSKCLWCNTSLDGKLIRKIEQLREALVLLQNGEIPSMIRFLLQQ